MIVSHTILLYVVGLGAAAAEEKSFAAVIIVIVENRIRINREYCESL
jgi:hypothetical protein